MTKTSCQVIGVASGKGGVGKTTVSVSLAVTLQGMGKQVMLFDADLGLANAQIALGCRSPYNMSHVIGGQKALEEIVVTTRQGVKLVPGASGLQAMAALTDLQAAHIVQSFSTFAERVDYLIVDMAAGIAPQVTTFMSACTRRLVVVRDDPSSIADAYGTIKVLFQDCGIDDVYLVPNAVISESEGYALFERINQVCVRFLGRPIKYLGSIEQDELVLQALKKFQSVAEYAPGSAAARDFRRLAEAIHGLPDVSETSGGLQFFVEKLVQAPAG